MDIAALIDSTAIVTPTQSDSVPTAMIAATVLVKRDGTVSLVSP